MKTEENIEKLFEGEELPKVEKSKSLPLISLNPEPPITEKGGLEKREFSRAEVLEQKLELKFTNTSQFARQYIENISMGGLFVKTEQRPPMGSMMPIQFSVPTENGPKSFELMAKVCRVSNQGVGLEFTNLSTSLRQELEQFVRSSLPKGASIVAKPKASTVENLERIRAARQEKTAKLKVFYKYAVAIGALVALNGYLLLETIQEDGQAASYKNQVIYIKGKQIPISHIRSIERSPDGRFALRIDGNSTVALDSKDIEAQFPPYLRHSYQLLLSIPPKKDPRRPQNTHGLSQLKDRF